MLVFPLTRHIVIRKHCTSFRRRKQNFTFARESDVDMIAGNNSYFFNPSNYDVFFSKKRKTVDVKVAYNPPHKKSIPSTPRIRKPAGVQGTARVEQNLKASRYIYSFDDAPIHRLNLFGLHTLRSEKKGNQSVLDYGYLRHDIYSLYE